MINTSLVAYLCSTHLFLIPFLSILSMIGDVRTARLHGFGVWDLYACNHHVSDEVVYRIFVFFFFFFGGTDRIMV